MKKTAKITALCNQKGGVGKMATAVNLGIGLAREGITFEKKTRKEEASMIE